MNMRKHSTGMIQSPWLDQTRPNLFQHEFQVARENLPGEYFTPIEPYRWIFRSNGENLFFKGLACLAPMFALQTYRGQVAVWTSPPPSGRGDAIYLVMGHDKDQQLRLVGGNYFSEPKQQSGSLVSGASFFENYDQADQRSQIQLVKDTVEKSIQPEDASLLLDIRHECEHFHTMAIYITVLTDPGSMFHAGKAVIEGVKPADFSYEFFGEIK